MILMPWSPVVFPRLAGMEILTLVGTGLVTGIGLIAAVGAQNAYLLRRGLLREHVGALVALCALSDIVLIGGASWAWAPSSPGGHRCWTSSAGAGRSSSWATA